MWYFILWLYQNPFNQLLSPSLCFFFFLRWGTEEGSPWDWTWVLHSWANTLPLSYSSSPNQATFLCCLRLVCVRVHVCVRVRPLYSSDRPRTRTLPAFAWVPDLLVNHRSRFGSTLRHLDLWQPLLPSHVSQHFIHTPLCPSSRAFFRQIPRVGLLSQRVWTFKITIAISMLPFLELYHNSIATMCPSPVLPFLWHSLRSQSRGHSAPETISFTKGTAPCLQLRSECEPNAWYTEGS